MRKKLPKKWCLALTPENYKEIDGIEYGSPRGYHYSEVLLGDVKWSEDKIKGFTEITQEEYDFFIEKNKIRFLFDSQRKTIPEEYSFLEEIIFDFVKKQLPRTTKNNIKNIDLRFELGFSGVMGNLIFKMFKNNDYSQVENLFPHKINGIEKATLLSFEFMEEGVSIELTQAPSMWSDVLGGASPKELSYPHTFKIKRIERDNNYFHILTEDGFGLFVNNENVGTNINYINQEPHNV